MNSEVKAAWIEALRSGNYAQGNGFLHNIKYVDGQKKKHTYCCLGVLCELAVKAGIIPAPEPSSIGLNGIVYGTGEANLISNSKLTSSRYYLPLAVQEWAELEGDNPQVKSDLTDLTYKDSEGVADLNDRGYTFTQIAELIETQL